MQELGDSCQLFLATFGLHPEPSTTARYRKRCSALPCSAFCYSGHCHPQTVCELTGGHSSFSELNEAHRILLVVKLAFQDTDRVLRLV